MGSTLHFVTVEFSVSQELVLMGAACTDGVVPRIRHSSEANSDIGHLDVEELARPNVIDMSDPMLRHCNVRSQLPTLHIL